VASRWGQSPVLCHLRRGGRPLTSAVPVEGVGERPARLSRVPVGDPIICLCSTGVGCVFKQAPKVLAMGGRQRCLETGDVVTMTDTEVLQLRRQRADGARGAQRPRPVAASGLPERVRTWPSAGR
jgi:hypothetical protein